ncbi:MAG TPA: hypothetical protein PKU70_11330 [Vicinamibacteria bacterium]|nr:hypothetical protein [Vicinamibacteria bacterium]HRB13595.1 hypothetical protein [Vicinamibacteria bacterium]
MKKRAALAALGLGLALAGMAGGGQTPASAPPDSGRPFEGTWSASGRRQTIPTETGGSAAIVEVSGAISLTVGEGLSRGFRGELIGFDDGQGLSVGRSVWTDERGDRLFSRIKGESLQTGKRFVGAITGGTGRYAGLEGEYSFTWQYVVSAEEGLIQGRTVGLSGRVRRSGAPQ